MIRPIVVIDDSTMHVEYVVTLLRRAGYSAVGFTRAQRAMEFVERSNTAIVVTDLMMPDMDGIEVLRFVRERADHIDVVGMSGSQWGPGASYLRALEALGAAAIVEKPLDPEAFLAVIAELCRRQKESACRAVA